MKQYGILKTDAETIRDEKSTGANTAARVGGHLADLTERVSDRVVAPIAGREYRRNVPTIAFKYDFESVDYMTTHAAFKSVNGNVDLPITYFVAPQEIDRGIIKAGIADIVFTAAIFTDTLITTKATIYVAAGGLSTLGLAPGMMVSFSGTSLNTTRHIIDSLTDDTITVYEGSGLYSGTFRNKSVSTETIADGDVDMYLGQYGYLTYANLVTLVNGGDDVGTYSRNRRAYGSGYGWDYPDDEMMWSLTNTARAELQAGIRAAAGVGTRAATYVVDMYVCPTYQGGERAVGFLRQAGFRGGCRGTYGVPKNVNNASASPFNINEVGNGSFSVASAKDSGGVAGSIGQVALVATDESFAGLEVGDPIVVQWGTGVNTKAQFRTVATVTDANNITVDSAWDTSFTVAGGAHWYDPLGEVVDPTYGTGDTLQPICGYINEMLRLGSGWLCVSGHFAFASAQALKYNIHGIALQYANWLNTLDPDLYSRVRVKLGLADNGEPIDILVKGMSDTIDDYYPNCNAGVRASISDAGAHIDAAYGPHFILEPDNNYNVQLGYNAGVSFDSAYRVGIGYRAGYAPRKQTVGTDKYGGYDVNIGCDAGAWAATYRSVFIGHQAGKDHNAGDFTMAIGIGYQAMYDNKGRYSIGIGPFALKNNRGHKCVAIGYGAGSGNTEDAVFIVQHTDTTGGATGGATPLVKGYFDTGAIVLGAPSAAVADALMGKSRVNFWLTEGDTPTLNFRVKGAGGAMYDGSVSLTPGV